MTTQNLPENVNQFEADVVWNSSKPLVSGRQYCINLDSQDTMATVTAIKYRIDENGSHLAARILNENETGRINLFTSESLKYQGEGNQQDLNFLLIDTQTDEQVGSGTIVFALRRATNIRWQTLTIDKVARSSHKLQVPKCIWFTGLSGSGKSTIANLLEKNLYQHNRHTYLLDGDNVRHGLCRDLGFTEADRVENIRRVSEVAKLMLDAGLIVLVSFISPFRSERNMARELFGVDEFIEVFIDTDLHECERRDVKGLYAKARKGELSNFTGIDSPYEPPESPEIHIQTPQMSPQAAVETILKQL